MASIARVASSAVIAWMATVAVAEGTPVAQQMQLVWQDEFEGVALDPGKWEPMIGDGCPGLCGWGNNELQFYRAENATVGGGHLTITARRESFGGRQYTSARLRTRGLAEWQGGRFEMRAKLPTGRGLWPAFWMLPTDSTYGTWAASGEIDIMELVGHEPNRVHGTIHYGASWPNNVFSGNPYTLPSGTFNDDFHVFALEWDPFELRWYVDGQHYATQTAWWSAGAPYPAPFDQPFHLLLNLAVGGDWPGSPSAQTQFPQSMIVDWVRVWQEAPAAPECPRLFDDMEHAAPGANGWFSYSTSVGGGGIGADTFDVPPGVGGAASLAGGWGGGGAVGEYGGFGRTFPTDLSGATHFEFWLNPDAGQDWVLQVNLQDDDNGDGTIPSPPTGADDEFQASVTVGPAGSDVRAGGGWQRVVLALDDFVDDPSYLFGGNGILDAVPTQAGGNGQLINVVFALLSTTGQFISFRTDQWEFTRRTASVAGRVWSDLDGDGVDTGEPGLSGVTVTLIDAVVGDVLEVTATDAAGHYAFSGQRSGTYTVRVDPTTMPVIGSATADRDGLTTKHEFTLALECDATVTDGSFGYEPTGAGTYCFGEPNSRGPGARIARNGALSLATNEFELVSYGSVPGTFGLFFFGTATANQPFGDGRICIGGSLSRLLPALAADALGTTVRPVDFSSPPANAIAIGTTWYFQYWYRDAAGGPAGFNTSDGLMVTFVP